MNSPALSADVLIIGGGPAGLSAALYLGRACKSVLVLDAGVPRHRVSAGVHNFITREGTPPAELRRLAYAELQQFEKVTFAHGVEVASLSSDGRLCTVVDVAGREYRSRAVLIATGVIDEHPPMDGLHERWGKSVHHCPYCHGWEMRGQPIAVVGTGMEGSMKSRLLRGWTDDVVLLTNDRPLAPEFAAEVGAAGIPVLNQRIVALEGPGENLERIIFADGTSLERSGLFLDGAQRQVPFIERSGIELDEKGGYIRVDERLQTSMPLVWAAGDVTSRMQQVIWAAAQGGAAAAHLNAVLTLSPR